MTLQPKYDNRRCSACNSPAERLMESTFDGTKFIEQPKAIATNTGIATHLCGHCNAAKTYEQTYSADLNNVRECVTDPMDSRFTQEVTGL